MLTKENKILQALQWGNLQGSPTGIAVLDSTGANIYPIDLETRKISAPTYLGVQHDHQSNIVYFSVPRYFHNMDLSQTTIIITYEDSQKHKYAYVVPYVDITTFYDYQRPYVQDSFGNVLYIPEYSIVKTTLDGTVVDGTVVSSGINYILTTDQTIQNKKYYILNENNQFVLYQPTINAELTECYEQIIESKLENGITVYEHYKTADGLQVFRDMSQRGLMLIPWSISGILMQFAGQVSFALKFFKTALNPDTDEDILLYELNTLPATSKILAGFDEKGLNDENYSRFNLDEDNIPDPINKILLDGNLWHRLESLLTNSEKLQIYWHELENMQNEEESENENETDGA